MPWEKINVHKIRFDRRLICMKVNFYLCYQISAYFLRWKLFFGETLCYLRDTISSQWPPCFLILPVLLVRYCTTKWSNGTAPVYLWDVMPRQWSPDNLPRVLRIWESVFYSQTLFTLHSFLLFQGLPEAGSSISKLAELHADLRT